MRDFFRLIVWQRRPCFRPGRESFVCEWSLGRARGEFFVAADCYTEAKFTAKQMVRKMCCVAPGVAFCVVEAGLWDRIRLALARRLKCLEVRSLNELTDPALLTFVGVNRSQHAKICGQVAR